MQKQYLALVAAALVSTTFCAAAQTLKPGLWQIDSKLSSSSGEMERALAEAQKQLATMPPDQRKMMESMMAKQGVGMVAGAGTSSVKVCMTQEMLDRNEVVTQQGDCKHTTSPRMGNTMKFSFVCTKPPSTGEGQLTFVNPEAYSMKMTVNTPASGKAETMKMDATGKLLSTECGAIKPLTLPKK